jgi:hypothetical protein
VSESQQPEPTFKEAMADAMRKSRLANGVAEDATVGAVLLGSVGGIRGIIESVLPTIAFVVIRLVFPSEQMGDIVLASLAPVAVAVVFVIARLVAKSPPSPAIVGAALLGITALLAIATRDATNNFLPGIVVNAVFTVVFLASLIARWPAVGVVVGLLLGERADGWREVPAQRAAFTIATWVWTAMYALRVGIEVPLYLASNDAALGIAKIVLGVPLYALVLVATWFLIRSVLPQNPESAEGESAKVS